MEPPHGRRVSLALFLEALGFHPLAADQRAERELDFAGQLRSRARGAAATTGLSVVVVVLVRIPRHLLAREE